MDEESKDVKTVDESSTSPAPESEVSNDAIGDSSSPQTVASQDEKAGQTMADVVKAAMDKAVESAPSAEEDAADSGVQKMNKTTEKPEDKKTEKKAEGEQEDATDGEEKKTEETKGPIPYERFQEVVQKRQEAEQQLEQYRPVAEQHKKIVDYCSANNVTQEQFSQALEIAALLNTNPAEAYKKLTPIVDSLKGFTGDKLPDDLDAEVKAGDLPLARAKEIAQLRAQKDFGVKHAEHLQKTAAQRAEDSFRSTVTQAVTSWETSKRGADPDYKPKAKATEPNGKWEFVRDRYLAMLHEQNADGSFVNPVKQPQDMAALMDRAYQDIHSAMTAMRPKPRSTKVLSRNGSSTIANKPYEEAKDLAEVVQMAAAKHGL